MRMRSFLMLSVALCFGSLLAGCGGGEPEYKIEGPTAETNPSIGAPVGAGAPVDGAAEGAVTGGKPAAPAPPTKAGR